MKLTFIISLESHHGTDNNIERWEKSTAQVFLGGIAPFHQHVVQIYEEDQNFLDLLTDFVSNGINANDCVIVIASESHLKSLDNRLQNKPLRSS